MTRQWSLVPWSALPEVARAGLATLSPLYSHHSQSLWKAIGGELHYLRSDGAAEALPVFVKRVGPFSHAQLFVQGLPVSLPSDALLQVAACEILERAFTRVTLVDFEKSVESVPMRWTQERLSTELLSITPDYEPPDPDLRSELRKAAREGLQVVPVTSDDHGRDLLDLFARHGKQDQRRFPQPFLAELARLTANHPEIYCLLARQDERAVGAQIFVCIGETLLYWLSVLDRSAVAAKPAVALLTEGIRRGARLGATRCNLGASPPYETGLLQFKRRWGSTAHEYPIYTTRPWWWPK